MVVDLAVFVFIATLNYLVEIGVLQSFNACLFVYFLDLSFGDFAGVVCIKATEDIGNVFFILEVWAFETAGQKFIVVNFSIFVSIDVIDDIPQFCIVCIFMLFVQSCLKLFDSQIPIRICVNLFEKLPELMNIFFRQLGSDVSRC